MKLRNEEEPITDILKHHDRKEAINILIKTLELAKKYNNIINIKGV